MSENSAAVNEEVQKKQGKTERAYSVSALEKKSMELFGISTSTFIGAFFDQDKEKKYTINQAKAIIESWKKKEAK